MFQADFLLLLGDQSLFGQAVFELVKTPLLCSNVLAIWMFVFLNTLSNGSVKLLLAIVI